MSTLYFLARSFLFWFGAIWLIAGGFFVAAGVQGLRKWTEMVRTSRSADAIVLSKSIHRANRVDNPSTRYEIVYRFNVDGLDYNRTAEVSVERWEALSEGGSIRISYLPDDFRTSRIEDPDRSGELVGMILGAIFGAIGGYLAVRELRRSLREAARAEPSPLHIGVPPDAFLLFLRSVWGMLKMLGIVVAAIVISELVPPVKNAALYIDRHQTQLLTAVVSTGILGFILMMGGILYMVVISGQSAESFSMEAMKSAWRAKAYRTSVIWRRRFITAIGAALLSFGLLSLFIVIGPPWLKVLMTAALVYVVVRTAIGVRKAS